MQQVDGRELRQAGLHRSRAGQARAWRQTCDLRGGDQSACDPVSGGWSPPAAQHRQEDCKLEGNLRANTKHVGSHGPHSGLSNAEAPSEGKDTQTPQRAGRAYLPVLYNETRFY